MEKECKSLENLDYCSSPMNSLHATLTFHTTFRVIFPKHNLSTSFTYLAFFSDFSLPPGTYSKSFLINPFPPSPYLLLPLCPNTHTPASRNS